MDVFFTALYTRFLNQGWSLLSHAPELLNVALPDFSVEYIAASFRTGDRVTFIGETPICSYVSLTVYNTLGLPIAYKNLIPCQRFVVTIGKDLILPPDTGDLYCVIYRTYQVFRPVDFPTIFINGLQILQKPILKIESDSFDITIPIQLIFATLVNLKIQQPSRFFKPIESQTEGLFPNPDAAYLIGAPSSSRVIRVEGVFYNRKPSLRFIGFMASNLSTTATDASINWDQFPSSTYTFYVAYSKTDAQQCGWTPDLPLLLWKRGNRNPVIVYREVRLVKEGIFLLGSSSAEAAEAVMGIHYPKITFF